MHIVWPSVMAITSAITAAFGIGGGIAMMALMGLFVPVAALIPVHGAVQLGSNGGRAWHQRAYVDVDIAKPFVAGSAVGAIVGVFLVVQLPDALLKLVLGGFILLLTWARIPGIDRLTKAGLALDSLEGVLKGAKHDKVLTAGDSANSKLVLVVAHIGDDPMAFMPKGKDAKKLSDEQIGLIRAWIDQGAK